MFPLYSVQPSEEAELELKHFAEKWDGHYSSIAIELLNSIIHKAIKSRRVFPNDTSAFKIVFLAIQKASKKWTMSIRNWKPAMNRFLIEYEDLFAEI